MPFQPLRIFAQVAAHPVHLLHDNACMVQQRAAGIGRLHAAPVAEQQGHAQQVFHAAQPRTGGRQRQVRAPGAGRDAAALYHMEE